MKKVYSVFDRKVGTYHPGYAYEHEEQAIRTFVALFRGEPNMIAHYPEDFELRYIGEFDERTGKLDQTGEGFASTVITGIEAMKMARRLDEKEGNPHIPILDSDKEAEETKG